MGCWAQAGGRKGPQTPLELALGWRELHCSPRSHVVFGGRNVSSRKVKDVICERPPVALSRKGGGAGSLAEAADLPAGKERLAGAARGGAEMFRGPVQTQQGGRRGLCSGRWGLLHQTPASLL